MSLISNVVINSLSIMILMTLYVYARKQKGVRSIQDKIYSVLLLVTAAILTIDIFSRFDGNPGTINSIINRVSNFLLFILNPLLPSLWLLYIGYRIGLDEMKMKKVYYILVIINAANAIITVISTKYGWLYYIDSANVYHRGVYAPFAAMIPFALLSSSIVAIIMNRRIINERHFYAMMFFPIPGIIGTILQMCLYGFAYAFNGAVISLLILLLYVQDDRIYTDYLTGIGNRMKLEAVMDEKISKASKGRTFSMVMLDIDNFKEINDMYGHNVGDTALKTAAQLLSGCVRSNDYVTRYGGDEFCLVLDISNRPDLDAVIHRIRESVTLLNSSGSIEFRLGFSLGYTVYDYRSKQNAEELMKQVDQMMYEDKKAKLRSAMVI